MKVRRGRDAGIGDHDGDGTQLLADSRIGGIHLAAIGHINRTGQQLRAGFAQLGALLLQRLRLHVQHRHRVTVAREHTGNAEPYS